MATDRMENGTIEAMGGFIAAGTIGWAGVGNMGRPMVERLLAAGHTVVAFDPAEDVTSALKRAGHGQLHWAPSVAALAGAEVVFVSLPSNDVVLAAVQELLSAPAPRVQILVNTGTTGASLSTRVSALLAERGLRLVDCPVSGGPEAARAGLLAIMASGAPADIERLRPLFAAWGAAVTFAGEAAGAAQTLKLVNNAIIVANYVATLEAFVFGAKSGLEPAAMLAALNAGRLAHNGTTRVWLPDYILRGKPFGAKLSLLMKDMGLAMEEANAQGVPMAVCEASLTAAIAACGPQGLPESADLMDLVTAIEKAAGHELPRHE